jgi:hypothetical protein
VRSKYTHSAKVDFGKKKNIQELVGYYLFTYQLVFYILLVINEANVEQTSSELKHDLKGFCEDKEHYHKQSKARSERLARFERYLSGEEPLADGESISI